MMTHDEMIAVIQAHKDGKPIQRKKEWAGDKCWSDLSVPTFDFTNFDHRIKPEPPKPREFWLNTYSTSAAGCVHSSREEADRSASHIRLECIHLREVL